MTLTASGRAVLIVCALLAAPFAFGAEGPAWQTLGLGGGGGMFAPAISPHDGNLMFVSCDMGGLYRTVDGGKSWRMVNFRQLAGNTECAPVFHPTDHDIIYAADGRRGLCVSHDRGVTWTPVAADPPWGRAPITALATGQRDASLLLVGAGENAWVSGDAGVTWSRGEGPAGPLLGFHVADGALPGGGGVLFTAGGKGVWRSEDGGRSWALKSAGLPWTDIRSFAGGTDGKTGATVLFVTIPSKAVGGAFAGGVYLSRDLGESWQSAMGEGMNTRLGKVDTYGAGDIAQYRHLAMASNQTDVVYVSNYGTGYWPPNHNSIYRSRDSGTTWDYCFTGDPRRTGTNVELGWYTYDIMWDPGDWGMAASATHPNRVLHAGGKLYLTEDGGGTWHQVYTRQAAGQGPVGKGQRWQSIGLEVTTTWEYVVAPDDPNRCYICYTDIGFARSLDGGKSWISSRQGCPWENTWYGIVCDPERPGVIYAACSNVHDIPHSTYTTGERRRGPGGVCLSTDYGATWTPISQGLPEAPVTSIVLDPTSAADARTLYVASIGHGVYKSTDGGQHWVAKSKGLGAPENMQVWMVERYHDGTLYACVTSSRVGSDFPTVGTGLYRSSDGGENWEHLTASLPLGWPTGFAVHPDNPDVIYLCASCGWTCQTGGLYKTTDGGRTWSCLFNKQSPDYLGRGLESFFVRLHPDDPETVYYSTGTQGLMLSPDGGKHWQQFDELPFDNIHRVTFDPADHGVIYVTTFGGGVWRGPARPAANSAESRAGAEGAR